MMSIYMHRAAEVFKANFSKLNIKDDQRRMTEMNVSGGLLARQTYTFSYSSLLSLLTILRSLACFSK